MFILSPRQKQSGFSLIEVLIAVVVLATGLLAMAALQGKLATNSADAKARSRIAALLTSVIDDQRASGYSSISSFAKTSCTTTTPTTLQSAICGAEADAAISDLGLTQTVTTYYGLSSGGVFTTTKPTAGTDYVEYKKILLTATWTDAAGAARSIGITNIASALGLSGSSTLLNTPLVATSITPSVHQPNPSLTAGVIPIAVGQNTDAASTNPQPTIDKTLPSTSFNTLTYTQGALDSSISATIQKRVETVVAECVCQLSSSNPLSGDAFLGATTFRPTYWNGTKYVAPKDAKVTPYSAQYSLMVGAQDDRCTLVCRDHHDSSTDTVKYDSVTGDYNRYQASVTTTKVKGKSTTTIQLKKDDEDNPIPASGTDVYLDAGRMIRVDGLWRVATDIHAEHMGLLATEPKGVATTSTPDSSAEAAYEDFVIDYLGQRLNALLNSGSDPVADTVFDTHGLNSPERLTAVTTSGSYKYLHGRGLYLDHLEDEALTKLENVNSGCAAADFPKCLLPYLPFNTINVTQLATWKPLSESAATNGRIGVTNSTTSTTATSCNGTTQVRACVSGVSASSGTTDLDQAILTMGKSNSAVAASQEISPYELDSSKKLADAQQFEVSGTDTASEFFAELAGQSTTLGSTLLSFWTDDLSTNNEPTVQWNISANFGFCFGNLSRTDTNPNPYDCVTTVELQPPFTVTIGNYNQVVEQNVANPCAGGTGTYQQPTLVCYSVEPTTVTLDGTSGYTTSVSTSGTAKTTSEKTVITISGTSAIPASTATLRLNFITNGTAAGTATCDAVTLVPTFVTPTTCN